MNNFIFIILIIISVLVTTINYFLYKSKSQIIIDNTKKENERDALNQEIYKLITKQSDLNNQIHTMNTKMQEEYKQKEQTLNEKQKYYEETLSYAKDKYLFEIEKALNDKEAQYDREIKLLQDQKEEAEAALQNLQNSLSAGVQAQLREREKEERLEFYKLKLSSVDLEDIQKLNQIKLTLHNPVILSKLIWTNYFQKQTTEMCNRVLGTGIKCGIYKITNVQTQQCYIGQSKDIATRWKAHIKCGLGIEASATNKLYNAMQESGVWNYTFELIEECQPKELNEKETFWIKMYQSDKYGHNTLKGVNKI